MTRFEDIACRDALVAAHLYAWRMSGGDEYVTRDQMLEGLVVKLVEQRDKYHQQLVDFLRNTTEMPATFGQINTFDMRGNKEC